MDKCKLVAYDTSMETDVEGGDETVENLEEMDSQIVEPTEHQNGPNLISMKHVVLDELIIGIPLIVRNETMNVTLPLKDFSKMPITKDENSDLFHLHIDEKLDLKSEFDLKSPTASENCDYDLKKSTPEVVQHHKNPKESGKSGKSDICSDSDVKINDDLMEKLNESVEEALFVKTKFTAGKKLPTQVGVIDDGELCKDFPFAKKVSMKMSHNTLGLSKKSKEETFLNPNTEEDEFPESKGSDVIPPQSIFQPGNFDATKFAKIVLESSYEIFENKEGEDNIMDNILDSSTKSSLFYRDQVKFKLDELNENQDDFADKDLSVNLDTEIEDSNSQQDTLEDSNPDTDIQDCSTDIHENDANHSAVSFNLKSLQASIEIVDHFSDDEEIHSDGKDLGASQNIIVPDSPLSNHSEDISPEETTVVADTDDDKENKSGKCIIADSCDLSFDIRQNVPKKLLTSVNINRIVDYEASMDSSVEQRSSKNLDVSCLPEIKNAVATTDNNQELCDISANMESQDVASKTEDANEMSAVSVNVDATDVKSQKGSSAVNASASEMSDVKPKSPQVNAEDSNATESANEGKDDVIDNSQPLFDQIDDCTPNVGVSEVGDDMENCPESDDSNMDGLNDDKNSTAEVDIENYK